jgi:altronate dehydratase small subunit
VHGTKQEAAWDAIVIHADDDVAVALRMLTVGEIRIRRGDEVVHVAVLEPIPMGHKIALRDLAAGALVRKYGEAIGAAVAPIRAGAHVHIHNLRSRRAQAAARNNDDAGA